MPSTKGQSVRVSVALNQRWPCRIQGCSSNRSALSPYCDLHARRVERHGHPEGRAIAPEEYAYERKLVDQLFTKHSGHAGLQSALKWLRGWLEAAARGEEVAGRREMRRLADAAVDPRSILVEAAALFLFSRWHSSKLPDDIRLDFAIGNRVLSLAPQAKYFAGKAPGKRTYRCRAPGKVDRRSVGQRIRLNLAPLLANAAEAIEKELDEKKADVAALHQPFTT